MTCFASLGLKIMCMEPAAASRAKLRPSRIALLAAAISKAPGNAPAQRPTFTVKLAWPMLLTVVRKPTSAGVASGGTGSLSTFSAWSVNT